MAAAKKTSQSRVASKPALKKVSFNWSTLAIIAGIVVVALGFLYYQMSKAATVTLGTQVWNSDSFQSFNVTDGYGGVRTTLPGSVPATTWYAQAGSFRISHQNLGAGTYCAMPASLLYGGGEAVVTISMYGVNGSTKVKTASTTTSSCVQVGADATYLNREFELTVTGGTASIGSVRFIANTAGTGGDYAWQPGQITINPAYQYGTLVKSWSPWIESTSKPSGGTATSPAAEYTYVKLKPVSNGYAIYCVDGSSAGAVSIGFDGTNTGSRDVEYTQVPAGPSGYRDFHACKTLNVTDATNGLQVYITGEYGKKINLNLITRSFTVGPPTVTPVPQSPSVSPIPGSPSVTPLPGTVAPNPNPSAKK